jgi:hypothetical protein
MRRIDRLSVGDSNIAPPRVSVTRPCQSCGILTFPPCVGHVGRHGIRDPGPPSGGSHFGCSPSSPAAIRIIPNPEPLQDPLLGYHFLLHRPCYPSYTRPGCSADRCQILSRSYRRSFISEFIPEKTAPNPGPPKR